jgi:hypothetical protein
MGGVAARRGLMEGVEGMFVVEQPGRRGVMRRRVSARRVVVFIIELIAIGLVGVKLVEAVRVARI